MTVPTDFQNVIDLFQKSAEQLDSLQTPPNIDQATVMLAKWIAKEKGWLTKEDQAALVSIGGILFRDQRIKLHDQRIEKLYGTAP